MSGDQPVLIGLTGSIGMGKTTTANMFRDLGVPVWDADAAVHRLYAPGGAGIPAVAGLLPDAIVDGAVDRQRLKAEISRDPAFLPKLEAAVHPLVARDRQTFIEQLDGGVAVLDIPLLFETGAQDSFDHVLVVTAPSDVQRRRVLDRPGMTEERFQTLLSRQMPDDQKRARADFIIDTSRGLEDAREQVQTVLRQIQAD